MNTPTPETDEHQDDLVHADTYTCWQQTLNLARNLERERDEARRLIKDTAQGIVTSREEMLQIVLDVTAERDQLRKVCDSLARDLSFKRGEGEVAHFFVCKFGGLKLRAGLGVSRVKK